MEKENHGSLGPVTHTNIYHTWVLNVNLQCCKACTRKVKKQLMQINEVTDLHIDTEKGLVTVSGVEDASVLVKAIQKAGKKAELSKFGMKTKHKDDQNCTCRKNTHDSDSDKDVHARRHFNGHHGAVGSSVPIHGHHHPQFAMQGGHAGYIPGPMPPYPYARPYMYEGPPPMAYGRPPPYPYNYYQPRPPVPRPALYPGDLRFGGGGPAGNSLFHTFSDMNVNSCTIT